MNLSKALNQVNGLRHICDLLPIQSTAGRRRMLAQEFERDPALLKQAFESLSEMMQRIQSGQYQLEFSQIEHILQQLHDIQGSIANLKQKHTLDDIELFEIKRFALLAAELHHALEQIDFTILPVSALQEVIALLDPDGDRMAHFFIYSAYSNELAELRKKQKIQSNLHSDEAHLIHLQCVELEDKIRRSLSEQLNLYQDKIDEAFKNAAELDFLIARASLAVQMQLCIPLFAYEVTSFEGLFNPQVKDILKSIGIEFQNIDIQLYVAPCLITGANMSGKTLLLKTIALNQYLFQFGFAVAATKASIVPVDEIMFCVGDDQNELHGLSSFAAEMLKIHNILSTARSSSNLLVLIDEPAQTTNPHEGIALVNALLHLLENLKIRSLITTHYSGLQSYCRKLRVKGLTLPEKIETLSVATINQYMDYALLEHQNDEVPMEALKIASLLGVDNELIETAITFMESNNRKNKEI